eukprot:TRINITY_DN3920_c0_g1_i2.p1 TRINITY_DN3920_c0_g1~~TRINITY_DN3920_c0_g1_i2.p1  ORF type:complete len:447 (+),score=137.54 TRINITY_DN3920_c0_g1_i2:658-1998(+)
MQNLEVGPDDRPLDPPKIFSTRVMINPFDDIAVRPNVRRLPEPETEMPRGKRGEKTEKNDNTKEKAAALLKKMNSSVSNSSTTLGKRKAEKKLELLSFADDDLEEEQATGSKIKSSHDILDDPHLLKEPVIKKEKREQEMLKKAAIENKKRDLREKVRVAAKDDEEQDKDDEEERSESEGSSGEDAHDQIKSRKKKNNGDKRGFALEMRNELREKQKELSKSSKDILKLNMENEDKELAGLKAVRNKRTGRIEIVLEKSESDKASSSSDSGSSTDSDEYKDDKEKEVREKQKEEYNKLRVEFLKFKRDDLGTYNERRMEDEKQEVKLLSALEKTRLRYLQNKKTKMHEDEVLAKLNQFRKKLNSNDVLQDKEQWMNNKLKFHIDSARAYSHQQNKERVEEREREVDDLMTIDPLRGKAKQPQDEEEGSQVKLDQVIKVDDLIKMTD